MKIVNFEKEKTIVSRFVGQLRDLNVQNDSMRFRRNLERIGEVMAYEISKNLSYGHETVTTPLGTKKIWEPKGDIVLSTILRAGLPLHQGLLNYFDNAENAFVSAYRKYTDSVNFDIHIEYISSPTLDDKILIIADPMLATGYSMELAYKALLTKGKPCKIYIVTVIGSREGVDYINSVMPEDSVMWIGAIDEEMNSKSYIIPGLGDAGDLAFGTKD